MGNVYKLKPGAYQPVANAALRCGELADALRCIEKLMVGDEEPLRLISNDMRGLMKLLTREADAIGAEISDQL